jgi:hypothetical protein
MLKKVQNEIKTKMIEVNSIVYRNASTNAKQRQQIMLVYNYITLYAQLSTIVFAREMTYNTSQQNVLLTSNQRRQMYIKFNMKSKEYVVTKTVKEYYTKKECQNGKVVLITIN